MRCLDEHLANPSFGDDDPHRDAVSVVEGHAGGSCGVLARFRLQVDAGGRIVACSARVRGRAAAYAAASALCEAALGAGIVDAARLGLTTLHPSFARLDEEQRERALVVEDAFHHALGRWATAGMQAGSPGIGSARPRIECAIAHPDERAHVVVGMSGGVDSAVALHRCMQAGSGRVVGATLRLWIDPRAPDPDAACCSPDSVRRARVTCHAAGVAHLSIDLRDSFAREVVAPFIGAYAAGQTPNPCVRCNGQFRLDELVRLADLFGARRVATGHYARIVHRNGVALIQRGVDAGKDQSYMLARVEPATVGRMWFPLGEEHKGQVRSEAAGLGLEQASAPESQEVCFLGGGDYRTFLQRAGALGTPGEIVRRMPDGSEQVVGAHEGVARFTPGQRRGIGIAADRPLYVQDVDPSSGRVVVGEDEMSLDHARIRVAGLRWHDPEPPTRVHLQVRYRARQGAQPARVELSDEPGVAELVLEAALRAPAPGQAAVLYDDEGVVLGIGRIARSATLAGARPAR